ncbi:hypothetical protein GCM10027047_26650 [Rhodococcus aerolatus]
MSPDPDARCAAAIRAMYDARGAAAVDALVAVLAEDFRFTPAGSAASALQAEYTGAAGFADFLRRQADWTADSWWPVLDSMETTPTGVLAHVHVTPTRTDGVRVAFSLTHHWDVRDGLVRRFHSVVDDQAAYDRFHTSP